MPFSVNAFKANITQGITRNSLFQVVITNPINAAADLQLPFWCQAAMMPPSTLQKIETHYFGRAVPLAGNRTFEDWTVTIINDESFAARNALENWSNAINAMQGNIRETGGSETGLYESTAQIMQYGKAGQLLRTYQMVGIWPLNIGQVQLSWENETLQVFDVTFALTYWFVAQDANGNVMTGD